MEQQDILYPKAQYIETVSNDSNNHATKCIYSSIL